MIRIIIINHTFQKPKFCKRWEMLANSHPDEIDVTLLAPAKWIWGKEKSMTYGSVDTLEGATVEKQNFRIHLIDMNETKLGDWKSKSIYQEIDNINPDLIYFIGGFTSSAVMQIIDYKNKKHLHYKICAFTMRGHTPTIDFKKNTKGIMKYVNFIGKKIILEPRYNKFKKYSDAVFCHYPDALEAFRKEGYTKPIYMQTQVGVDTDIFHYDKKSRYEIRELYNIGDSYLFGSASRFHFSKGLSEIIKALPKDGNWKYLMMGWGTDEEVKKLREQIAERGFEDKVILTGYIDNWEDMAKHWCALDCAIHTPLTTPHWEETFSLALVQAMATGLPVIGSNSGSVPYQIGPKGIIVEEGNIDQLAEKILFVLNNPEIGREIGLCMRERATTCFSIKHLNDLFYETILDIMKNVYDASKVDMSEYNEKSN